MDGPGLTAAWGEMFGLLGPKGAGKTPAVRRLTALLPGPAGK
ncbi:hypothetical protein ACWD0J_40180 [Streptomyces sp. NPDC003011]